MTSAAWVSLVALSNPAPAPDYHVGRIYQTPVVAYWSDRYLVPRWLGVKIAQVESDFTPSAQSYGWKWVAHKVKRKTIWKRERYVISRGLVQINVTYESEHLRRAGLRSFDWANPSDNARIGVCFLGSLLAYFGEVRPSVAGYNAGRVVAAKWYFGGEALPDETKEYIQRVLGTRKNPTL